ncbi:MAG: biotin--[acetyl-CoA-carboxylase] ligase [Longimicrobiales bacterium]|nr:biotin--[acetyl-CoA-carboxylase] ligase [Longimicrobiales bacterium]
MSRTTHWEGEPARVWAEVWGVPEVEAWTRLGSTNARARELIGEGEARPWTVVLADEQTHGRGREGRLWSSPPEGGLWFSVIVPVRAEAVGLLPLRTGVAVLGVLRGLRGLDDLGLKWPNDLWWRDRKAGGILCEGVGDHAIVGIGINTGTPADEAFDVRPVGLEEIVEGRVSRASLMGALVARLRGALAGGGARLTVEEMARLDALDQLRDRAVRCDPGPGGVARGFAPDGALRIETGRGIRSVYAGSVRPLGPKPRPTTGTG